ncbi:MAG: DUF131 domain-containing protein [Sulfolobales archaeon]|nr:DUF131 domain-containing protein [Sulfolobales archaeon]MDW7969219.1 DUF131 domain-containing protein [Sulfolobales archaeon]
MVSYMYLLMSLGMFLIFAGTFLILIDVIRRTSSSEVRSGEKRVEVGGAVIVGPIPIVFGSNKGITKVMLILAILLTAMVLVLTVVNYLVMMR